MNEIQQLQKRLAQGVEDYPKDPKLDHSLIDDYINGNDETGLSLIENYLDVLAYIYRFPFKPPNRGKCAKFTIRKPSMSREDREDLLQEILLQFFRLVYEYDVTTGKPFEALVKGKLHHRVYESFFREFLQLSQNERVFEDEFDEVSIQDVTSGLFLEEVAKPTEETLRLYEALNQLTEKQRKVIIMTETLGWSAREVAEEIGGSSSSVRNIKASALRNLRRHLGGDQ